MNNPATRSARLRHALAWATGLALLLALPAAAVLGDDGGANKMHKVVDGYAVELSFPAPPHSAGDNAVVVRLADARGTPALGTTVSVTATPLGGDATKKHGSGDAMKMGASHDQMDMGGSGDQMDMGGSGDQMDMGASHDQMDMGASHDQMDMNMDMGGSGDQMKTGGTHDHMKMKMGGHDHGSAAHKSHPKTSKPASPGTALLPVAPGVRKGLVPIGAGDSARMAVDFALAGASHTATFNVDLTRRRPRALAFSGFAAVNMLVLIAALFVRRREAGARRRPTT